MEIWFSKYFFVLPIFFLIDTGIQISPKKTNADCAFNVRPMLYRRRNPGDDVYPDSKNGGREKSRVYPPPPEGDGSQQFGTTTPKKGIEETKKFTKRSKTKGPVHRTLPPRLSFFVACDMLAHSCLQGYLTGMVCARTVQHEYETFSSYCAMDYMNCIERHNVWQLMFMGECSKTYEKLPKMEYYIPYPYVDDYHLDMYYVNE